MQNNQCIVNVLNLTMDIDGLAKILCTTSGSIRTRLSRRPETLPRPLNLNGNNRLIWLTKDVEAWLELARHPDFLPTPEIKESKSIGRPSKKKIQSLSNNHPLMSNTANTKLLTQKGRAA